MWRSQTSPLFGRYRTVNGLIGPPLLSDIPLLVFPPWTGPVPASPPSGARPGLARSGPVRSGLVCLTTPLLLSAQSCWLDFKSRSKQWLHITASPLNPPLWSFQRGWHRHRRRRCCHTRAHQRGHILPRLWSRFGHDEAAQPSQELTLTVRARAALHRVTGSVRDPNSQRKTCTEHMLVSTEGASGPQLWY